jgi:2-polyprenyl-6-methoxyphenol hydroxylase-like FAD-dependent oxidoreductase
VRTDVLIIGAGPAGLMLAALLAEHGVDVQILDSKSGPVKQSRAALVHVRTWSCWTGSASPTQLSRAE